MGAHQIAFTTVCLFCLLEVTVSTSEAATSFNGSTIIGIDQKERTVTFRTKEGDKWTLPVDDPEFLQKEKIAAGDQVSIEIDPNDKITKIFKPTNEPSQAARTPREEY